MMCDVTAPACTAALAASAALLLTASAAPVQAAPPAGRAAATTNSAALACSAEPLPTTPAHTVDMTVSLGATTATLSGTSGHGYLGVPRLLRPRLTLQSPGAPAWQTTLKPVSGTPGHGVLVAGVRHHDRSFTVCLARFHDGAAPVAVVALTSALNQCCTILHTSGRGVGAGTGLQDGAAPTRLGLVGGQPLIVTGDGRFLAEFADYADSGSPLRVLTIRDGKQTDVTRGHSRLLRLDARRWARLFNQRDFGLGFLACWAADQELLGHDALVSSRLADLDAEHRLTVPRGLGSYWPHGAAYITALRAFLADTGYLRLR
jgi:hypothetical protein